MTVKVQSGGGKSVLCPYDAGDLYFTLSDTDPSDRWPGTKWELLAAGTFVCAGAASGAYKVGSTGGEAAHVLTVDEMPRHTHSPDNANGKKFNMSASGDYRVDDGTVAYTDGAWSNWVQNLIYYTGGDKPHNNVPPYIAAYVWKCTSGGGLLALKEAHRD